MVYPGLDAPPAAAAADNRAVVLAAAREVFAERGYRRTAVEAVAARAGVGTAAVTVLFGDKAGLFTALVRHSGRAAGLLEPDLGFGEKDRAARVARTYLLMWESSIRRAELEPVYRVALGDPEASALFCRCFAGVLNRQLTDAIDRRVSGPGGRDMRAALFGAQLSGIAIARYLTRVEPLATAPLSDVIAWITPTLNYYLRGLPGERCGTAAERAGDEAEPLEG
ncbi:MAG TPA: TetR family transcriptional regulator [Actinocrinis sp.]|nr:TetR family transcriptional regulator [Actinocrinis sp.]